MNRALIHCGAFLLVASLRLPAQLPDSCKAPAFAHSSGAKPSAAMYDSVGAWFAEKRELKCAALAFEEALRLDPQSAEAHFNLGLVHQQKGSTAVAASELRLALKYNPKLLPARCALGSVLTDSAAAEAEFRKALAMNAKAVCALDGLAQVLLEHRRYDAALGYWREALKIQSDAADLQLSLATATYQSAKARQAAGLAPAEGAGVADAIHLFVDLLKAHPELTPAHFTLGNIYANEQRYREAADEYEQVTSQNPADLIALLARVKALVNASAYEEALKPAEEYVKRNTDDASGHVLLGTVYRGMGEYAKAEPELAIGAAKAPDDFQARYQFGFVLARLRKLQQAVAELRKAVALKPGDKSAEFQLATVLRDLGEKQEADEIVKQFNGATESGFRNSRLISEGNQANELLQSGKAAEAATVYRQMLEQEPEDAWTAYNLGLALEAMQDSAGARESLEKAANLDPKMAIARAELGQLELAARNLPAAQRWLESALDLEPQLVAARGNLAMLQATRGDLTSAEKLLRQALEDDPNYREGHLNLGLILAQQGRSSDAKQELNKAVGLAPRDPGTLSTAGKALAQMREFDDGIALLRRVIELTPDLAAAHLDLALALGDNYDLPAALVETSEAVRLAPGSGFAHLDRGRVLFDLGRNAEAQPELEAAYRLLPKTPEPRYFLALTEKQAGNYQRAASLLDEVVRLQPQNVLAWYLLGQSWDYQNETTRAIAAWRQAIAIDPNFSQALFSLARALRPGSPAEAERFMARYAAVQKERRILDRVGTLANNGAVAASAHEWPEATRQLKEAITECGECVVKAELHKKLGLIYCQSGDLDKGKRELLTANALRPSDPEIARALGSIAQARDERPGSNVMRPH
jgi:tetratricopeptide (TPR) repeat protein